LGTLLNRALADPGLGPGAGLRVLDVATGATLFDRAATSAVPHASTAKLLTAVAALRVLGPDRTLVTRAVRAGNTVVLVGGGDPTLASPRSVPHYPPAARLVDLAARTAAKLGAGAKVSVAVDDFLFTGPRTGYGWKPNYLPDGDIAPVSALELDGARLRPDDNPKTPDPRAADPALHAGRAFAAMLKARGITITGSVTRLRAPASAAGLARVESAPVRELVESMLARSDNDLAEALIRHLAIATKRPATFAGGAAAVMDAVADVGVDGPVLHDGSGLSTLDRATPAQLAALVATAAAPDHPELREVISGLPVAGFSGTLEKRFASAPPGRGVVRAKTGTLTGVSTLAGVVVTADGRLLAFAATAPHAPGTKRAQLALDRLLALIAGCGCR
jgi:D-alanyl-D-alanine carboxypeptidase/D-alanyl-D-alanine-endopeptidase (penicillin-binding protein 4)